MSKLRQSRAIILLVLLVIFLIGSMMAWMWLREYGEQLNRQAKEYAMQSLLKIADRWDPEELVRRASPELLAATPPVMMEDVLSGFQARFGGLEVVDECRGAPTFAVPLGRPVVITAAYSCRARFEREEAQILLRMILVREDWRIMELRISSLAGAEGSYK